MFQGIYLCKCCGAKLTEENGIMKCCYCSGNPMGISVAEVNHRVIRAKQWIAYGAYAEAKKELSLIEQYQIDGTVIQMLHLMMNVKVGTEEELKLLKTDFSQNPYFLKIMEIQKKFPQEAVAMQLADYAEKAVINQKVEENRLANQKFKSNCIWLGVSTVLLYFFYTYLIQVHVGMENTIARKMGIAWVVTAVWLFFREGLSEKIRILLTGGLIIAWIYIFF